MPTNHPTPLTRHSAWFTSTLALRLLFALLISLLIVLAFFGTNALSH